MRMVHYITQQYTYISNPYAIILSMVKVIQEILSHSYMESEYSHNPPTYPVIYVQQLKQKDLVHYH